MRHLFSTELNTLNFTFAFISSTYTQVVNFGHCFFQKSRPTLRLIRESTCARVYTVIFRSSVADTNVLEDSSSFCSGSLGLCYACDGLHFLDTI